MLNYMQVSFLDVHKKNSQYQLNKDCVTIYEHNYKFLLGRGSLERCGYPHGILFDCPLQPLHSTATKLGQKKGPLQKHKPSNFQEENTCKRKLEIFLVLKIEQI